MSIAGLGHMIAPRPLLAGVMGLGLMITAGGVARADCGADFSALMVKRTTQIDALNKISKSNGGKLDPVAACPRLRSLAAAEGEVVAYMAKNKEWCNLPDDVVDKMTATRAKTASYAAKACNFAVKIKDMKEQQLKQAQQGGPQEQAIKLPAGPL